MKSQKNAGSSTAAETPIINDAGPDAGASNMSSLSEMTTTNEADASTAVNASSSIEE